MKLSYNKVFDRYTMSFSDKLAESSYSLYRTLRLQLAKIFPLSEHEKYWFDDDLFSKEEAADMPQGFDYIEKKDVDSFVKLDYIDLYDYLPKEDLPKFIKELKKCVRRNKIAPFGAFRSREDIDKIDNFGRYYDGQAFTHILSVRFRKNEKLQQSCSDLSVSLRNLSATFLLVQYRVYITKEFNTKIAEVCKKKYSGYTTVYRQFNTPWYAVKKFGRSSHTGNNVRQEKIYKMISQLKWQILMEIRKTYSVRFWDDGIFTPTFETYSTNIRPSNERRNLEFWDSISFDRVADYLSDFPALIGAFAFGPISGLLIELVKNALQLLTTSTGGIGEIANFLMGAAYVVTAGFIYKRHKTKKTALAACVLASVVMGIAAALANYFILLPLFENFMPLDQLIASFGAFLPFIHTKLDIVLFNALPFNILKGLVIGGFTMLTYKRLTPILKGR